MKIATRVDGDGKVWVQVDLLDRQYGHKRTERLRIAVADVGPNILFASRLRKQQFSCVVTKWDPGVRIRGYDLVRNFDEAAVAISAVDEVPDTLQPKDGQGFVVSAAFVIRDAVMIVEPIYAVAHYVSGQRERHIQAIINTNGKMSCMSPFAFADRAILEPLNNCKYFFVSFIDGHKVLVYRYDDRQHNEDMRA